MFANRLRSELRSMDCTSSMTPQFYHIRPTKHNTLIWEGYIIGPNDCPNTGKQLNLVIKFAESHPFFPPTIVFCDTNPIENPYVSPDGSVDLPILRHCNWSPAIRVETIMAALHNLLHEPGYQEHQIPRTATAVCSIKGKEPMIDEL